MAYGHDRGWYTLSEINEEKRKEKINEVFRQLKEVENNPNLPETCEKLHRELTEMSVDDMFKVYCFDK